LILTDKANISVGMYFDGDIVIWCNHDYSIMIYSDATGFTNCIYFPYVVSSTHTPTGASQPDPAQPCIINLTQDNNSVNPLVGLDALVTGVTRNDITNVDSNNFNMSYTITADKPCLFIPPNFMLRKSSTITGATVSANGVFCTDTLKTIPYLTASANTAFSVNYPYGSIPDFEYSYSNDLKSNLLTALNADQIRIALPQPFANPGPPVDVNSADGIYTFGKKLLNLAQLVYVSQYINDDPSSYNTYMPLLKQNIQDFYSMPDAGSDPTMFAAITPTSNRQLSLGYNSLIKCITIKDPDPNGNYLNGQGQDQIIHFGYIIISFFLYFICQTDLPTQLAEIAKYSPLVIQLMRNIAQPYLDDPSISSIKHFDSYYGISWLATNVDGQNTESCSEVIMGYYACYLMAQLLADVQLTQFYKAILTLEIENNYRFPDYGTSLYGQLLTYLDTFFPIFYSTPAIYTIAPSHMRDFGIITSLSADGFSVKTLFGANVASDFAFIIFLPFLPITLTWMTKDILKYIGNKLILTAQKLNAQTAKISNVPNNYHRELADGSISNMLLFSDFINESGMINFYPNNIPPTAPLTPTPIISQAQYVPYVLMLLANNTAEPGYYSNFAANTIFDGQNLPSSQPCQILSWPSIKSFTELMPFAKLDEGISNTLVRLFLQQ
jgi:hypothetical protein